MIFAAADVSEQISTASKEASGTGNMKFMLNGAPTLGTMDGANVEIVEEVGEENAFIFGLSSDEVINYENNGGYDPNVIYNTDGEIRQVLMELINGTFSNDTELFRDLMILCFMETAMTKLTSTLSWLISELMQQRRKKWKRLTEMKNAGLEWQ